jgi:hypothetical protein
MATNSYLHKTQFENFHTLGYGDRIWPDVEAENWQRVENRLLAIHNVNFLKQVGVFQENNPDPYTGTSTVTLSGSPSFEGSINGSYFYITDNFVWDVDVTSSGTYYLYLTEVTGQYDPSDAASLEAETSSTKYNSPNDLKQRLLVAVVGVTGLTGITSIDDDPEGTEIEMDYVYDTSITLGTDEVYDMRTILGLPFSEPEVKFVSVCPTSLPYDAYIFSVEYNIDGYPYKFTIHSKTFSSYEVAEELNLKLLIKYSF